MQSTRGAGFLTMVSVKPGTPRTLEELREIYAEAPDDVRGRVERLWLAVQHAESKGIRASHLEEKATSRGHLSHVFSGRRRNLDVGTLEKYAKAAGVSDLWLINNHGEMVMVQAKSDDAPKRTVVYDERYPHRGFAEDLFRREAQGLGFDEEVTELAIIEARDAVHDLPNDAPPLKWFEQIRDIASGIRRERKKLAQDTDRVDAARVRDRARAAEMEEITRPKLPKRKVAK